MKDYVISVIGLIIIVAMFFPEFAGEKMHIKYNSFIQGWNSIK